MESKGSPILPTCPPSSNTRSFGQWDCPSEGIRDPSGTKHRCTIATNGGRAYGTSEEVLFGRAAAVNEIGSKNSFRTRFCKKPEHPAEVRPPVRLRARSHC